MNRLTPMKKRRRKVGMTLRILAVSWLAWCAAGCPGSLVLPANHEVVTHDEGARQQVLTVNNKKIDCWVAHSPGAQTAEPQGYVLFFVGKGERTEKWITAVAGAWKEKPVEVWGMNYPGSGQSTDGTPRLKTAADEALNLFDHVNALAKGRPIFIHAASFGTAMALSVSARRPVAGMVLQNPPPLKQLILGRYGWWNLWLIAGPVAMEIPGEFDSLENARNTHARAIFLLSDGDSLVPAEYQKKVVAAYAGEKRVISMPGAGHDAPLTKEAAEAFARDLAWVWQPAVTFQRSANQTR
jgi:uncharacterized protein